MTSGHWPDAGRRRAVQRLLGATGRGGWNSHLPFLAFVVLATLLASLPLLTLRALGGHDALAYLPRNVEFYQGLKEGQIFPRWAPDLAWGYGEPTFNFNPPVNYYLPSLFHFAGFGFAASEDLAALVLLLSTGIGMYFLSQQFFGRWGGVVSSVAYLLAPRVLSTLYVSHAIADFSSFAFMPWALWGIYRYTRGGQYRFLLLGAGGNALVFLSSSSVALFFAPTLALFAAWTVWRERSRLALLRAGWCLLLGAGLAAFFVLPAMLEQNFVHFERRAERFDFHDHFLYARQLFWGAWGYGLSVPGPDDGMSFALGPVHLLATAAAGVLGFRLRRSNPQAAWAIAFFLAVLGGAVFFSVRWSVLAWEALPILHPLQFPWRFLILGALATSFLCAAPLLAVPANRRGMLAAAAVGMVALLLAFNIWHAHPQSYLTLNEADYSPHNIAANGIPATAREFEPIWSTAFPPERPAAQKLVFMTGGGNTVTSQLSPYSDSFLLSVSKPSLVRINTFYFPGWQLTIDGQRTEIQHDNPYALIEFTLPAGSHLVELRWGGTLARTWGTWLSGLALLLLAATPWLGGRGPALFRRARRRNSLGSLRFFGRAGRRDGTPPSQ